MVYHICCLACCIFCQRIVWMKWNTGLLVHVSHQFQICFKIISWRTVIQRLTIFRLTFVFIPYSLVFCEHLLAQNILDTILNVGPTRLRENLPRLTASIFLCHPVHSVFQLLRPADQSIYCLLALAAAAAHGYKQINAHKWQLSFNLLKILVSPFYILFMFLFYALLYLCIKSWNTTKFCAKNLHIRCRVYFY